MGDYTDNLRRAMMLVASQPRAVFMGQAVAYPGTFMSDTLSDVPAAQKVELPVAEDMQMGMATGMALAGWLPVTIYPRWNFLLLAANQLVLHLDKLPLYSKKGFKPKVIIRVGVGTNQPLDPGVQHLGDYSRAFRSMLRTIALVQLRETWQIMPAYQDALNRDEPTILVEYQRFYQ